MRGRGLNLAYHHDFLPRLRHDQLIPVAQDHIVRGAGLGVQRRLQIDYEPAHRPGRFDLVEQRLADTDGLSGSGVVAARGFERLLGNILLHALGKAIELFLLPFPQFGPRKHAACRKRQIGEAASALDDGPQRLALA